MASSLELEELEVVEGDDDSGTQEGASAKIKATPVWAPTAGSAILAALKGI